MDSLLDWLEYGSGIQLIGNFLCAICSFIGMALFPIKLPPSIFMAMFAQAFGLHLLLLVLIYSAICTQVRKKENETFYNPIGRKWLRHTAILFFAYLPIFYYFYTDQDPIPDGPNFWISIYFLLIIVHLWTSELHLSCILVIKERKKELILTQK